MEEIIAFLKTYYEFQKVEESGIDLMLDYMKMDKKNEEGSIQYVQLRSIGEPSYGHQATREQLKEAILYYNSLV